MKRKFLFKLLLLSLTLNLVTTVYAEQFWPPQVGRTFPNIEFIDQNGNSFQMSELYDSVVLIEYIGMTCAACQAFSGAHEVGSLKNVKPQSGLSSIKELFPKYTGLSLEDNRIEFVQILLYSMTMDSPTPAHASNWASHFGFNRYNNEIIVVPKMDSRGKGSFNLIPGFQLLDKNHIVQKDITGHNPRHSLHKELLPFINKLL